jgi:hypothetical protein
MNSQDRFRNSHDTFSPPKSKTWVGWKLISPAPPFDQNKYIQKYFFANI